MSFHAGAWERGRGNADRRGRVFVFLLAPHTPNLKPLVCPVSPGRYFTMKSTWIFADDIYQCLSRLLGSYEIITVFVAAKFLAHSFGCPSPGLPSLLLHARLDHTGSIDQGGYFGRFGCQLSSQMFFGRLSNAIGANPGRVGLCRTRSEKHRQTFSLPLQLRNCCSNQFITGRNTRTQHLLKIVFRQLPEERPWSQHAGCVSKCR